MNPQYEILAKCLLPTHIPIRAVRRCCCDKEAGRKSIKKWYAKVGEFDNKAFNDIAAAMYDREDEIRLSCKSPWISENKNWENPPENKIGMACGQKSYKNLEENLKKSILTDC